MRAGRILPALAAALAVAAPAHGAPGGLEPVGPGHAPAISADGRFVAFTSSEPLAPGDAHPGNDVFLRDMRLGTTTLVSRASGAEGAGGDDDSYEPSISADGRFVAFTSRAANLDADASAGIRYVFVRDVLEGVTTLVSRASGPAGAVAAFASDEPDISGDGRFVAFASGARNIVDDPAPAGVVVRDLQTHQNVIASRADGPGGASLRGRQPSISADGRFVAFAAGDALTGGVLLRDLRAGTTELVSVPPAAGVTTDLASYNPSVSDDGRRVAFESLANTLSDADADGTFAPDVFLRDLDARTTTLLSAGEISGHAVGPAISADGRRVAFSAFPFAPTGPDGTYVHDAAAGTTTLVSRAAGAEGAPARGILRTTRRCRRTGRYVAFTAYRTGLEPNGGQTYGVFRRDVLGPPPGEPGPVCAPVPAPPAAPSGESRRFTLTKRQLLINQRVAQAAIRRLNAVQARLDGRLAARRSLRARDRRGGPGIPRSPRMWLRRRSLRPTSPRRSRSAPIPPPAGARRPCGSPRRSS